MLTALILAAGVTTAPPPHAERMPNFYNPPARCGELHEQVVRHVRTATGGHHPLRQYAVMRQVDGCMVPAPLGYRQDYLAPARAAPPPAAPQAR